MSIKLTSSDVSNAPATPALGTQSGEVAYGGMDADFAALLNACTTDVPQLSQGNSQSAPQDTTSIPGNTAGVQPRPRKSAQDSADLSVTNPAMVAFLVPPLPPAEAVPITTDVSDNPIGQPISMVSTAASSSDVDATLTQSLQAGAAVEAVAVKTSDGVAAVPFSSPAGPSASQVSPITHEPAAMTPAAQSPTASASPQDSRPGKIPPSQLPTVAPIQHHPAPQTSADVAPLPNRNGAAREVSASSIRAAQESSVRASMAGSVVTQRQVPSVSMTGNGILTQGVSDSAAMNESVQLTPSSAPEQIVPQPRTTPSVASAGIQAQDPLSGGSQSQADTSDSAEGNRGSRDESSGPAQTSSASTAFGMGGWIASTPAATTATGAAEADLHMAGSPGMTQLHVDRIASESSARRLRGVLQSDMMTGVQTDSFGRVHIKTSLQGEQLLSQISLEHGSAGAVLATHMPVLETSLNEKYGVSATVHVKADAGSLAGGQGTAGGDRGQSRSQDQADHQPTPRPYVPAVGTSRAAYGISNSAPERGLPLAMAFNTGAGRLDITI